MMQHFLYLTFSDAAKFADIARNLISGSGYTSDFQFWGYNMTNWVAPVMPFSIAAFFKTFGISDFAVVSTSFFFFVLSLVFTFLLTQRLFRKNLTAVLSTIAIGFNYDLINYATSGASESPFIFEIVAGAYFVSLKKWWGNVVALILLVLMYFTRPQAVVYILGLVICYLFINLPWKRASLFSIGTLVFGSVVYLLFSRQGAIAVTQNLPGIAVSDSLRGAVQSASLVALIKKAFYNLYNFYKLLPQIMSPYLFALFVVGIFRWTKDKVQNSFKIASIFMVVATFFATAITIPFFRYIHPVIPLIYIVAIDTLIWLLAQLFRGKTLVIVSTLLVLFFVVGQTLGIIFLDSRFEANTHNVGKPPVYAQLSYLLRDNTSKNQTIITNLDTWGSWYGERKTVWFPIEPKQVISSTTGRVPYDSIYLTSYLIDDENYYMGPGWRLIFNNPTDSKKWTCDGCQEIAKEFKLKGIYKVSGTEDYEKQDANAILLIKK